MPILWNICDAKGKYIPPLLYNRNEAKGAWAKIWGTAERNLTQWPENCATQPISLYTGDCVSYHEIANAK